MLSRLGPRRAGLVADALTIVSIVAVGVCLAAVLERGDVQQPDSRTDAAPTSEATAIDAPEPTSEPVDTTFRSPEVEFPTTIPGCDDVERPVPESGTWGQIVTSADSYDNPQYPWYSGPRSVMMTEALGDALPDGVDVAFGSTRESLVFQPIPQTSSEPGDPSPPGVASASAEMWRGPTLGLLAVDVSAAGDVPPCVAGALQERTTARDGTIVDANESWYEYGDDRTNFRSVVAYAPDGSQIRATASDSEGFRSSNVGERDVVLTIDELKSIVSLPQLRISAAIPSGTPEPAQACDNSFAFFGGGAQIDAATASEMNAALERVDTGLRFDHGLNSLMLAAFDPGVVCTHVDVLDTGADLSISIRGGQELPTVPDVYDPAYASRPLSTETLDGGAVVQVDESPYSYSPAPQSGSTGGMYRSVTVTYPSGTQVQVRSHAENPDEPLDAEILRDIATAEGLDVL
ncbi:hypothetical protein ASG84_09460 [Rhodococcus sp. Leaf278]|uniref:hypothetical protein n=1 Tax=Rhodococcus sp. Leaf278 TaxID=1736319 RepID=UPI00070C2296|nr:hypothetical protein [Rhodococcus sp. Leaf278]KQU46711.1 hypothetical protein ASG84_09460 [Rhodococcus sp. Leaf278]